MKRGFGVENKSINVMFLDIDGVVNTPMWVERNGKLILKYNFPDDGKVNNWQACQWVSKFCRERGYSIVVSSSWRTDGLRVCKKCLYAGGIGEDIPIIGLTPVLHIKRGHEIQKWLDAQKNQGVRVKRYLIVDDEDGTISKEQADRFVQCRTDVGFMLYDFQMARALHEVRGKFAIANTERVQTAEQNEILYPIGQD